MVERLSWENQAGEFQAQARSLGISVYQNIVEELKAWDTYKQSMRIVVDNPDCFPTYVYQAKTFIEENKGDAYRRWIKAMENNGYQPIPGKGLEDYK